MIMPYLHFTGDCEEAFLLYQRAFAGEAPLLARYSDAPESFYPDLLPHQRDLIMHGHVMLTETGGISGADDLSGVQKGSAIDIHVYCNTVEEAQKAFDILAEEGTVISKLVPNPPPHDDSLSGALKDKFGFSWILSVETH